MKRSCSYRWAVPCAALLAALAVGCGEHSHGEDGHDHGHTHEDLSGATCPPGSSLTYDNFGQAFMEAYCTSCHSSTLSGAARQGAPNGFDFDTREGILAADPEHIDMTAAAGPDNINTSMPPGDPRPSEEDRRRLGEWLACGAP